MTAMVQTKQSKSLLSGAMRAFLEFQNVLRGLRGLETSDLAELEETLRRASNPSAANRDMGMGDVFYAVWDATYEKFAEQDMWFFDLYYDESGQLFAILNGTGKLYRVNVGVKDDAVTLGDPVQVKLDYPEVEQARSISVIRQADGRRRWIAIASVAILNRSGELDARSLYDSIIRHREDGKDYPYATIAHAGKKFRVGSTDFMHRDGYCLIESGLFDETDIANALADDIEVDADWWGTSISFFPEAAERMRVGDIEIPVYTEGWQEEISFLKETSAASFMTGASAVNQERSKMSKTLEEALLKLGINAEEATALSERSDERNRAISDAAVIKRQSTLATPDAQAQEAPVVAEADADAAATVPVEAEPDPFAAPAVATAAPVPVAEAPVQAEPAVALDPTAKRIAELEALVAQGNANLAAMQQSVTESFKTLTEALMGQLAEIAQTTASANRSMSEAANERMDVIETKIRERTRNIQLDVPRRGTLVGQPTGAGQPAAGISRPSERQNQQVTGGQQTIQMTPNAERLAAFEKLAN